jgi:hypothetical protein
MVAWACLVVSTGAVADSSDCDQLDTANWIVGDWVADDGTRTVRETWRRLSPDTFEGSGETRTKADDKVVDGEALLLVRMAGGVFYIAKVAHNHYPVALRLVECSDSQLVFTNPSHDFPRRLEYTRLPDEVMSVAVSDGGERGFTLRFRRQAGAN